MRRAVAAALLAFALAASAACADSKAGGGLYIALGDSLSVGIGASDPGTTGFVPLVHAGLGDEIELLNLGHGGDTSLDLLDHQHVDDAVNTIRERNGDGDPGNDVQFVTLEIGGNDLLRLYFSLVQTGVCPDLETSLERQDCVDALRTALDGFPPNLATALNRLQNADEDIPIVLLTLYNPFDHLPDIGALGDLSLEGRAETPFAVGLNGLIREAARAREGIVLVDLFPLFEGRSEELVADDQIHPNDAGYRVMADAVLEALGRAP